MLSRAGTAVIAREEEQQGRIQHMTAVSGALRQQHCSSISQECFYLNQFLAGWTGLACSLTLAT
jgi:hypothetical protein